MSGLNWVRSSDGVWNREQTTKTKRILEQERRVIRYYDKCLSGSVFTKSHNENDAYPEYKYSWQRQDESQWDLDANGIKQPNLSYSYDETYPGIRGYFSPDALVDRTLRNLVYADKSSREGQNINIQDTNLRYLRLDDDVVQKDQTVLLQHQNNAVENGVYNYDGRSLTPIIESWNELVVMIEGGKRQRDRLFYLENTDLNGSWPTDTEEKYFTEGGLWLLRHQIGYILWDDFVFTDALLEMRDLDGQERPYGIKIADQGLMLSVTWDGSNTVYNPVDIPTKEDLKSLSTSDTHWWCVGNNGLMLKLPQNNTDPTQTDPFTQWEKVQSKTFFDYRDISFLPDTEFGVACGENGLVQYTDDRGENWTTLPIRDRFVKDYNQIYIENENRFWLVGERGYLVRFTRRKRGGFYANRVLIKQSREWDSLVETDFLTVRPLTQSDDPALAGYENWLVITGKNGLVAFFNKNNRLQDNLGNDFSQVDLRTRIFHLNSSNAITAITGPGDDPDGRPYDNDIVYWDLFQDPLDNLWKMDFFTSRGIRFNIHVSPQLPVSYWDVSLDLATLEEVGDWALLDDFRYATTYRYVESVSQKYMFTLGKIWECQYRTADRDVTPTISFSDDFKFDLRGDVYQVTTPPPTPPVNPTGATPPGYVLDYLYSSEKYLEQLDTNLLISDYFIARKLQFLRDGNFSVPQQVSGLANPQDLLYLRFLKGADITPADKEWSNSRNVLDYKDAFYYTSGVENSEMSFQFTRDTSIRDTPELVISTEPDRQLYFTDTSSRRYDLNIENGRLIITWVGTPAASDHFDSVVSQSLDGEVLRLVIRRDDTVIVKEDFVIRSNEPNQMVLQERFEEGVYGQISNELFYGTASSYTLQVSNLNRYATDSGSVSIQERVNQHPLSAYYGARTESGELFIRGRSFVGSSRGRVVCNITQLTQLATSGTGSYWTFITADSLQYYVWYNVDSGCVDPALVGLTGIEVAISSSDGEAEVARKTSNAINDVLELYSEYDGNITWVYGDGPSGDPVSVSLETAPFIITVSPYTLKEPYNAWYYNLRTVVEYDAGSGNATLDVKYDQRDLFAPDYTLAYYLSRTYGLTPSDLPLSSNVLSAYSHTTTSYQYVNKFTFSEDFGLLAPPEAGFFYDVTHSVLGVQRLLLQRVIPTSVDGVYHLKWDTAIESTGTYDNIVKRTTLEQVSFDLEQTDDFHRRIDTIDIDGVTRRRIDGNTNKISSALYTRDLLNNNVLRSFFTSYMFTDDSDELAFYTTDPFFDRNLTWLLIDLFPTGADLQPQKALEVKSEDYDISNLDQPNLVESLSYNTEETEERENFRMIHNLTLGDIWNNYFWILNAKVKSAVITVNDEGRIEWYKGDWICGRWEDGVWWNGRWFTGTWVTGEWHSRWVEDRYTSVKVFDEETRLQSRWFSGNFLGGTWFDGTWYDGYWEDATHLDGDWFDGFWFDGLWNDGAWRGGTWRNGTWENGVWNGFSAPAVWWNGIWNQGFFENGTWIHGIWNSTNERQSIFGTKSTLYRPSKWLSGTWNGGRWYASLSNTDYRVSRWYSGTWNDGYWFNGIWYQDQTEDVLALQDRDGNVVVRTPAAQRFSIWNNGKWHSGVWRNGTWNDGQWLKGVWLDGTWYDGTWYAGNAKRGQFLGGVLGKSYRTARKKRRAKPVYYPGQGAIRT